jgi:acyl-CoA reductase-like NAD-dependent aldehyde dehydrogenase
MTEHPSPPHLQHHIAGEWRSGDSSWTLTNPADTTEAVAHVPHGDDTAVTDAVDAAAAALPSWRQASAQDRAEILTRAASLIEARRDDIARAITLEMGKPISESRVEVGRAVEHTRYFATVNRQPTGYTAHLASPAELGYTIRAPLGVVALICPWNFPAMITNWKLAPALAMGNTVVLKPSEIAPLSATLLVQAYIDAGLPAGVLNLVLAPGPLAGSILTTHPAVAGLSFTGSTPVGQQVAAAAAAHGKRAQCEMGGKNALVVMPDADLDSAVAAIIVGGFGTTGQRCTSSSRVLAHRNIVDELRRRLDKAIDTLVIGPGLDKRTTLGPMASDAQRRATMAILDRAIGDGATVLRGGSPLTSGGFARGWFFEPTLLLAPHHGAAMHEEIFGPIVSLHEISSLDEAIEVNNSVRYGLSAAIFTNDFAAAQRFVHESDTGMVHVNRPTVGAEVHMPFGGAKASALGTPELGAAADFFTKVRSAHLKWPR